MRLIDAPNPLEQVADKETEPEELGLMGEFGRFISKDWHLRQKIDHRRNCRCVDKTNCKCLSGGNYKKIS